MLACHSVAWGRPEDSGRNIDVELLTGLHCVSTFIFKNRYIGVEKKLPTTSEGSNSVMINIRPFFDTSVGDAKTTIFNGCSYACYYNNHVFFISLFLWRLAKQISSTFRLVFSSSSFPYSVQEDFSFKMNSSCLVPLPMLCFPVKCYLVECFCQTWIKKYLFTSQTRVKPISQIHHRTIVKLHAYCVCTIPPPPPPSPQLSTYFKSPEENQEVVVFSSLLWSAIKDAVIFFSSLHTVTMVVLHPASALAACTATSLDLFKNVTFGKVFLVPFLLFFFSLSLTKVIVSTLDSLPRFVSFGVWTFHLAQSTFVTTCSFLAQLMICLLFEKSFFQRERSSNPQLDCTRLILRNGESLYKRCLELTCGRAHSFRLVELMKGSVCTFLSNVFFSKFPACMCTLRSRFQKHFMHKWEKREAYMDDKRHWAPSTASSLRLFDSTARLMRA